MQVDLLAMEGGWLLELLAEGELTDAKLIGLV
jgi:hypothetical protein